MLIDLTKKKTLIVLVVILVLGFILRAHNLNTWPRLGATFDEYAWTWLGMSLIEEHVPSSWSPHEQYEGYREHLVFQNAEFWIVKPYLEHPPGFGLVAGSFALLNGTKGMLDISIDKIRPLSLLLGLSSIFLLFLLVKEVYDEKLALLASFIYSTTPTVVIGSRIVQNENFFIPMFLLALLFISKYLKTKNVIFRNLAGILCGILIISKIPWIAATLAIVSILFFKNKYKDGLFILGVTSIFFLGFILYGIYYNADLFFNLWGLQLARYDLTFNSLFALFTQPYLVDRYMVDGWIYFGWIAFFLLLAKDLRQNYIIIFSLLSYLAVFIFAIPNEAGHGWYRYPFYPFLALSLAIFLRNNFNKNLLLTAIFIIFTSLSLLELTWTRAFGFSFIIFRSFLILVSVALLPLFFRNQKLQMISSKLNYLLLSFIFILNICSVFMYSEQ